MSRPPRSRLLRFWVPILVGGLLVTLYFMVFGRQAEPIDSAAADSFSRSALGHHALIAFLEASGTPVLRSRHGSAAKARPDVPLLLLEPPSENQLERFELMAKTTIERGVTMVVVLPKWTGEEHVDQPGKVTEVTLLPARQIGRVLAILLGSTSEIGSATDDEAESHAPRDDQAVGGLVARPGRQATWPPPWTERVHLPRPQLIADGVLEPVLAAEEGVLAGWLPGSRVLVIADPDLLNNAGLAKKQNAALVEHLLIATLEARGFVLDEVLHGYGENVRRALLRFPFVCLTLHLSWLALLVTWRAAKGRFGRPLPVPPRLARGKQTLIDNTAQLLALGHRGPETLCRYLESTLRRALYRAGLAPPASLEAQAAALSRLTQARGARHDIAALTAQSLEHGHERGTLALARDIHAWYQETFDGAHRATHHR